MIKQLKNAALAALMTATFAAPAFAQSTDHTGSQLPHYFSSNGAEIFGSWGPPALSGLNAVARVPESKVGLKRSTGRRGLQR